MAPRQYLNWLTFLWLTTLRSLIAVAMSTFTTVYLPAPLSSLSSVPFSLWYYSNLSSSGGVSNDHNVASKQHLCANCKRPSLVYFNDGKIKMLHWEEKFWLHIFLVEKSQKTAKTHTEISESNEEYPYEELLHPSYLVDFTTLILPTVWEFVGDSTELTTSLLYFTSLPKKSHLLSTTVTMQECTLHNADHGS